MCCVLSLTTLFWPSVSVVSVSNSLQHGSTGTLFCNFYNLILVMNCISFLYWEPILKSLSSSWLVSDSVTLSATNILRCSWCVFVNFTHTLIVWYFMLTNHLSCRICNYCVPYIPRDFIWFHSPIIQMTVHIIWPPSQRIYIFWLIIFWKFIS